MINDLERLRRKIARIDRRYQLGPASAAAEEQQRWRLRALASPLPPGQRIEELAPGEVLQNAAGACFRATRVYPFHKRHGNADISSLCEMIGAPLGISAPPSRWAFLDTETTGVAGGTGTYCFLIGVGFLEGRDFRVHQFLMRDYSEEAAQLDALAEHLAGFDVLVTYNGKTFDAPLLETRYRMSRRLPPLERLEHLDVLHSARRLFRLRLPSCRLVEIERAILGFEREGDLPGEMVPYYYFDYLRTHNALKLVPILHHNLMDIVTLACVTGLVLAAAGDPDTAPLAHPVDLFSLAAWVAARAEDAEGRTQAARLFRRALAAGLPEAIDWRARAQLAALYKRDGDYGSALPLWDELCAAPNGARLEAAEELAKYFEHRARDYPRALEAVRTAIAVAPPEQQPAWRHRLARLERKLAKAQPGASPLFAAAQ